MIPRSGASTRNATAKASSNATLATVRRPKVDVESRTLGLDRNTEACSSRPGSAPPEIPLIALLALNGLRIVPASHSTGTPPTSSPEFLAGAARSS